MTVFEYVSDVHLGWVRVGFTPVQIANLLESEQSFSTHIVTVKAERLVIMIKKHVTVFNRLIQTIISHLKD